MNDRYKRPETRAEEIIDAFRGSFREHPEDYRQHDLPEMGLPVGMAVVKAIRQAEAVIWRRCAERVRWGQEEVKKYALPADGTPPSVLLMLLAKEFEECAKRSEGTK